MKRKLTHTEYDITVKQLKELGFVHIIPYFSMDNSYINGVTVFETSDSPDGVQIRYIEDDLVDDKGNPYMFEHPYYEIYANLKQGSRLIALYVDSFYCLLPINGSNYTFFGAVPSNVDNLDKNKLVRLPNPLVLNLPKQPERLLTDDEKKRIKSTVKKNKNLKVRSIIASVLLSILAIIFVGLFYIVTIAFVDDITGGMEEIHFIIITIIAVILLIASIVGSIVLFKDINLRIVSKMKYIKQVMFCNIMDVDPFKLIPVDPARLKCLVVHEWKGDEITLSKYSVVNPEQFLGKDAKYGDIIYMLTPKPEAKMTELNSRMFLPKI